MTLHHADQIHNVELLEHKLHALVYLTLLANHQTVVLNVPLMQSALQTWHALMRSAKILALEVVESMHSVQYCSTMLFVYV